MPQRQRLSEETRMGIVRAHYDDNRPTTEIAKIYGLKDSTVRMFLLRYRKRGSISSDKLGGSRFSLLDDRHLKWLAEELDEYSNKTIDMLRQGLVENFLEDFALHPPSSTTVWRAVTSKLRYRLKVLHVEPIDYNLPERKDKRLDWCQSIQRRCIDLRECVYIDESGFNLHVSNTYGRAAIGRRPIHIRPSARGPNLTLVLAMSAKGILAYDLITGGFNREGFASFLRDNLFPKLDTPKVMIMDNASIHKYGPIPHVFNDSPHTLEYLPPYSPYLNAAEWVFGYVKPHCARRDYQGRETLKDMVRETLWTVNSVQCQGWIEAVSENWMKSLAKEPLGHEYQLKHLPCIDTTSTQDGGGSNQDNDDDDNTSDDGSLARAVQDEVVLRSNEVDDGTYRVGSQVLRTDGFDDPPAV